MTAQFSRAMPTDACARSPAGPQLQAGSLLADVAI
jgi:hypothetical protein